MTRGAFVFVLLLFSLVSASLEYESEWEDMGRTDTESEIEVSFLLSLKMKNLAMLDHLTELLTTPGSPMFRKWKTMQELNEITRPDEQKTRELLSWLVEQNLKVKAFGNFIRVLGKTRDVETAFKVEYRSFRNNLDSNYPEIYRSLIRATIPAPFTSFIEIISGISEFPVPTRTNRAKVQKIIESDDVKFYYTVPQTLYNQYGMPNVSAVASSPKSSQGVAEFGKQYGIIPNDLTVRDLLLAGCV